MGCKVMKLDFKIFIAGIIIGGIGLTTVYATGTIKKAYFNENKIIFENEEIRGITRDDFVLMSVIKEGEENSSNYAEVTKLLSSLGYYVKIDREKNIIDISTGGGLAHPKYAKRDAKVIKGNSEVSNTTETKTPIAFPKPPESTNNSNVSNLEKEAVSVKGLFDLNEEEIKNILINNSWRLSNYAYMISLYNDGKIVRYSQQVGKLTEVDIGTYTIKGSSIIANYSTGYYINDEGVIQSFAQNPDYSIYNVKTSEDKSKIYMSIGDSTKYFMFIKFPIVDYYKEP